MRAYAKVTNGAVTFYIPATSNRASVEETRKSDQPNGWYRATATFQRMGLGGQWALSIGKAIDPAQEAKRLQAMALKGRDARAGTAAPGIKGYLHRANNATQAIRTQAQISSYFANMLSEEA